jgi:hypothetical protein
MPSALVPPHSAFTSASILLSAQTQNTDTVHLRTRVRFPCFVVGRLQPFKATIYVK